MRYLDPKNDLTFKKLFAEHPHLLISFLNSVLPLDEGQKIETIEYLPADMVPPTPLFKSSIVDVRCKDNFGRQFIVEMQMLWTDAFKSRVLFNASKAYIKQLEKGEAWDTIQPVYALSLVNQNFDHQSDSYYHHFKIVTVDEPKLFLDGLEFVFIELPKVKARNLKEKALGVLWLRFLAEIENRAEQISPDFFEVPELMEATEILKESAFTETELASYDKYWDTAMVEKALLQGAKMEGIEEEKLETIFSAFAQGLSIEIISKITRLSVDEVSKILKVRNLN